MIAAGGKDKKKKQNPKRTKEGGLSLTSAHAGHLFHSLFCFDYFSAVVLYQIKSIDCNNSAQSACRRLVRSFFYSVINVETTMTDGDAGHIQYPIYIKCNGRKFGFSFFFPFSLLLRRRFYDSRALRIKSSPLFLG